jgi:acyl carrier protein
MQETNLTIQETVESSLIEIVEDLIQDWGIDVDGGINGATQLLGDLDFASVDIIQLCVAIEENYDRKFGFQDLLMNDGSYVSDLSIAQLAKFMSGKM